MKYKVLNCPAYNPKHCDCLNTKEIACLYRTDCVMKQIVELCKNNQKLKWQVGQNPEEWISFNNPLSYQILQLLDIQEAE